MDPATTEIYPLSLHDALPIWEGQGVEVRDRAARAARELPVVEPRRPVAHLAGHDARDIELGLACRDRKSTRLNSSHTVISYAVFCLKKKTKTHQHDPALTPEQ